ncbi:hypothetical protein V493_03349 [Pseudogymnoascus sp. VKM F-4281 (FW-2241)]|nr:hypothetical protein V493_03349 [Pseudogymnoascus sp. VKM F-4281 (FW-2241)]
MTAPLTNDEFFIKLSELFDKKRTDSQGSVFLTQKRLSYSAPSDTFPAQADAQSFPDLAPTQPLSLLIRATDGKHKSKTRLSTVVTADALEDFFNRYAEVCKGGMSGLKKRDRSKAKARQKAKKKVAVPAGEEKK